jgi:uncharacterized SAM-binding protein YcdF (DUF218 family)
MFILSKILGLLTEPLTWVTGLLVAGLLMQRAKPVSARRLQWSALAVLLAVGWLPLPNWLSQQLEGRYAEIAPQADLRGYVGVIVLGGATELFFDSMGLPPDRVQYESASRNTFENAVLTAKMPGIDITQRWLLVTSASHMPRSVATFTKAGWNVTAYPVDFRTGTNTPWLEYSQVNGAEKWGVLLHELLGLLAYRVTDRL